MLIECEHDLMQRLANIENVRVYGIGQTGRILSRWLAKHHIEVSQYITTKKEIVHWGGADVLSIDDAATDKSSLILVAVTSKYREEIEELLLDRGFSNVISLTDNCIEKIAWLQDRGLYFQIHIVDHCNLNCRGCYHFSSLSEESFLDIDEFEKDIQRLGTLFDGCMERILLLGGEPLLHPDINKFIITVRRYFPLGEWAQIFTKRCKWQTPSFG